MKFLYLSLLSLSIQFITYGQLTNQTIEKCGQHQVTEKMRVQDPLRYQTMMQSRNSSVKGDDSPPKSGTIYTIPVVFHILHNNGVENIGDAQIHDAMVVLNRDFRKLNADVTTVVPSFQPIAADIEIEFVLAKIAPDGSCFEGITRTVSAQTNNGGDGEAQIAAIIAGNDIYNGVWPHANYMNVYVCKDIGGAAGYTFLPNGSSFADATSMYYNGIFMVHDYTGSIGTSAPFSSRTLTHEVGHWLNLEHTWGSNPNPGLPANCSDDDGIADTPNTRGSTSCDLTENSCGPLANVENYMDYSYCSKMFTQGQSTHMRTAVTSAVGGRNNLWSTTNLQNTGVIPGGSSACSAEIDATFKNICQNTSTTFSITNIADPILTYAWTFTGGTPTTSTAANPTITYNTAGSFQVSVTYTTASGTYTINRTNFITVAAAETPTALPITEGFVATTFPPANWTLDNGGNPVTWVRNGTSGTAPTIGNSTVIDNYSNNTSGDVDDLNSPSFSLVGYTTANLTFDVAYKLYDATNLDKLEVLVSPGCGLDFEVVYSKQGTTLQTEPMSPSAYLNPTTWRNESVDLSPYLGNSQLKVKFRNTAGFGNYLYLDNINLTGVSGIAEANFTPSITSACTQESITFTDASTGASIWNWNFGAGATPATATGAGPHTVVYSTSGTKNVSLDVNTGVSIENKTITINGSPSATLTALPTVCIDQATITLNQGTPAGGTYSGTGVSGNQFTPSTSGSGNHTITYSVTENGCTGTATNTITVEALPIVTLNGLPNICVTQSPISLSQGSPSGGSYSGIGITGNQFDPSVAGVGPHTITYSYSTPNGCSNTTTNQIIVESQPTVTLNSLPTLCVNQGSVNLNQGTPSGGVYSGTGVSGSQFNPSVAGIGTHTITYNYTTSGGCSNSTTGQITVSAQPSVTLTPFSTVCLEHSPFTLTQGSPAGGTYSGPGIVGGTQFNPSLAGIGTKLISYTYSVNGCSNTVSQQIFVDQTPNVVFGAIPSMCVNHNPLALTQATPAGGTYSGNGVVGNQFDPEVSGVGSIMVSYTYSNSNGCTSSASTIIVVNACLGLEDEELFFDIYPNPSNGRINISSSSLIETITVIDNVGKIVFSTDNVNSLDTTLELYELAKGSYQIQTKTKDSIQLSKIILQ